MAGAIFLADYSATQIATQIGPAEGGVPTIYDQFVVCGGLVTINDNRGGIFAFRKNMSSPPTADNMDVFATPNSGNANDRLIRVDNFQSYGGIIVNGGGTPTTIVSQNVAAVAAGPLASGGVFGFSFSAPALTSTKRKGNVVHWAIDAYLSCPTGLTDELGCWLMRNGSTVGQNYSRVHAVNGYCQTHAEGFVNCQYGDTYSIGVVNWSGVRDVTVMRYSTLNLNYRYAT